MRIAFFHTGFTAIGGAEVLASMQAKELRARGDEVSLLTFAYDADEWDPLMEGIPVEVIPKRSWLEPLTSWSRFQKSKARGRRALRRARGVDAVLAHNTPCHAMLGLSEFKGLKAWYCHEPPRGLYPERANPCMASLSASPDPVGSAALKAFLSASSEASSSWKTASKAKFDQLGVAGLDLIIANSDYTRENARRIYGRGDIEVVHPMVRLAAPLARPGLDRSSGLRVLVHSRLEPAKNIDTVLRGFAAFRGKAGPGASLHIVGEGTCRPDLEALAADLGLAASVQFHGFLPQDQLEDIYDRCDVMALLPIEEPFGLVFPEAMARGLVVVGPDHGGPVEILEGGRLGWMCGALDPESLADALHRVWKSSDSDLDSLRARAAESCHARFSPRVVGERLRSLLLQTSGPRA